MSGNVNVPGLGRGAAPENLNSDDLSCNVPSKMNYFEGRPERLDVSFTLIYQGFCRESLVREWS